MQTHLKNAVRYWGRPDFHSCLKTELESLNKDQLPLQQALSLGSVVADAPFEVMIIGSRADAANIHVKIGIFFKGVIAGCSCADDPTPLDEQNEYCEMELAIARSNGACKMRIL